MRQHGTRPLRQWHRWEKRVHCCCGCVWPYGLHGTQSTHHRWWCLGRRARAVALALEEGRCACATARYAASQAVASLGEASALLLRLCVALRPAQHAEHSPQVVVLGEEGSSCCSCPRGGEVRVCDSTVRGLSGSGIAGRSECTAAAAVCGLAACTARRALTTGGGAWGGGLELLLLPSRRRGARVRQHGTRPLRQWHRWEKRVHCCCGCVWPCGLHSTQSTHHRWWCLGRRARAVALALEEGRCACATARYAASQAVASLGEASALLLRLCVALRPAQRAEHSPQVVVLGEEGSSCCSCPRGGEVRVCDSTVRGLSGSGIAGRSECTAAAAVCGLAACTARRALTTGGGAWGGGLELLLLPSRRRGARVRQHGTRPLRQWHRWEKRVHCCCGCVWPCGLHSTQSTHHRWWCLVRRARAVALAPRGGEVRVCESTVRGLSGSGIAGRSECTAAAAVCGLAACTARRALTTGGGAWGGGLELLLLPSRRGGARVRKHGTRPLRQ